jgi:hypothetical protein
MNFIEIIVINKLKANRDRFILPVEKDIIFFLLILLIN